MLMLSEKELDWLAERIPDAEGSAKGGRQPADKREVISGIFWVLDNGAKWNTFLRVLVQAPFIVGFSPG
jgi:transposase